MPLLKQDVNNYLSHVAKVISHQLSQLSSVQLVVFAFNL